MQLMEPAEHRYHLHRTTSSKSASSRLASHYGNSREVLAPTSTPALTPGTCDG